MLMLDVSISLLHILSQSSGDLAPAVLAIHMCTCMHAHTYTSQQQCPVDSNAMGQAALECQLANSIQKIEAVEGKVKCQNDSS